MAVVIRALIFSHQVVLHGKLHRHYHANPKTKEGIILIRHHPFIFCIRLTIDRVESKTHHAGNYNNHTKKLQDRKFFTKAKIKRNRIINDRKSRQNLNEALVQPTHFSKLESISENKKMCCVSPPISKKRNEIFGLIASIWIKNIRFGLIDENAFFTIILNWELQLPYYQYGRWKRPSDAGGKYATS